MKPSNVLNLLGLNTTILRIAPGEKRPIAKEWQKLRPSDMTPDYLASFAAGEGIRVSLDEAAGQPDLQRQMRAAVERKELVHKAGQAPKASQQKTAVISSAVGRDRRGSLTSRPAGRANLQVVSYYVNYSKICVLYSL